MQNARTSCGVEHHVEPIRACTGARMSKQSVATSAKEPTRIKSDAADATFGSEPPRSNASRSRSARGSHCSPLSRRSSLFFPACRFATHARNRQFLVAPTSNRPLARPRPWQVRSRARHPRGSRLAPPQPPPPRDARDARRRPPRHRRRRFALAPRPAATTPTARHRARRTRSCGSMPGGRLCATRPRRARRRRAPSGSQTMRSRRPLARRALFTTRRRHRDARRRTSRRPRSCARRV